METKEQYLLEAKNLSKYFPVKNFFGQLVQEVRALDRVNLSRRNLRSGGRVRLWKVHTGPYSDPYV